MIQHGDEPFLECSSRGDKRFSAFFARVKAMGGMSIEDAYQGAKIFEDGSTGLAVKDAKGRNPVNREDCARFYHYLWLSYLEENPELMDVLLEADGLSDIFGQRGRQCQATTLWKIRAEYMAIVDTNLVS